MASEQQQYHSYLLRLWQACNGDTPEWRIVLEEVRTRERQTFTSVAQLADFLQAQISGGAKGDGTALAQGEMIITQQKGEHVMMFIAITLAHDKDERTFKRFMLDEIFPAVDKHVNCAEQVTGLMLLKGNNTGHTNEYLWPVYRTINGSAALQQTDAIQAFEASMTPMIDYVECGHWFADSENLDSEQPLHTDEGV